MKDLNKILNNSLAGFIAGIVIGVIATLIIKSSTETFSSNTKIDFMPSKITKTDSWLIKIDDYMITEKDFNEGFNMLLRQIPQEQLSLIGNTSLIKKQYLDSLIGQTVLLIKGKEDKLFDDLYIQMLTRQVAQQNIIQRIIPADKNLFLPTENEINDFYLQNKIQFDKSGISKEDAKKYIMQDLYQKKIQMWLEDYISKIKENYKIQRNEAKLKAMGIE